MFNFSLDFRKLVTDMLPPKHRKPKFIDWLYVLVSAIRYVHGQFTTFVDTIRFDLRFTSQVIYLEYLLNLKFNGGLNTILIKDGSNAEFSYIWQATENQPLYVNTTAEFTPPDDVYLYNNAEYSGYADFVVMVPSGLVYNRSEMIALINRYKLAGKIYTINTY